MPQSWHNQVVALLPKSSGNLNAWVPHQDLIGNFLVNIKTMKTSKTTIYAPKFEQSSCSITLKWKADSFWQDFDKHVNYETAKTTVNDPRLN